MGDWIKMEKSTPDKPEITLIAADLGAAPETVFLACFRLWAWADTHSSTGMVPGITPAAIDRQVNLPGFANALVKVGWLLFRSGGVVFPNIERHIQQSAKARAANAERARRYRERKKDSAQDGVTRDVRVTSRVTSVTPSSLKDLDEDVSKEEIPKSPPGVGLGGVGEREGASRATCARRADDFDLTPEGLAQAFCFVQRPKRDCLEKVTDVMREILRLGEKPEAVQADIYDEKRRKSEYMWEFEKRHISGGAAAKPRAGQLSIIPVGERALAIERQRKAASG